MMAEVDACERKREEGGGRREEEQVMLREIEEFSRSGDKLSSAILRRIADDNVTTGHAAIANSSRVE
jgi:hypothetical protein